MHKSISQLKYLAASFLAVFMLFAPVLAKTSIEDRLTSVQKLVTISSAARKIQSSNKPEALLKRNEAIKIFEKAKSLHDQGNIAEAEKLLTQATQTMFEAVRLVELDESIINKHHDDFNSRLETINALCQAYDRIRDEKGLPPANESELYPLVQSKLKQAKTLETQGEYIKGRAVLDEAYVAAKVAIEHIRGGDTLTRSLDFKSKEEEYDYEIDRNDTHKMLVEVLLREKMDTNANIQTMVNKHMDAATNLRVKAEKQAAGGDYDAAVQTLEMSTKEIVRAIRSAGIYIPG